MLRLIKQSRRMGIEAHIHAPLFLKANDILFTYIYIYILDCHRVRAPRRRLTTAEATDRASG
jgi:phosphatidylserine decarboxylase